MQTMLKTIAGAGLTLALIATASLAVDYSKGSKAKEWGLTGEAKARFSGKVVDILCELSGNCTEKCGDGLRQLGIVRSDDNKLIVVPKNGQAAFNGATDDLLPYCGKMVDVDGLLVGEDEHNPAQVFMVQRIRVSGEKKWKKARRWTKVWRKRNPDAKGKGPWFRRDPRVKKQIAATGYLGLGKAADEAFAKENE